MSAGRHSQSQAKLSDSQAHGAGCELILVEGDSAASSVVAVRDARTQAVLPLQGKPLNAWRADAAKVRDNILYRQIAQADQRYTDEVEPRYGEIDVPVLVVWGKQDRWIPVDRAHRLGELIPGARVQVVEGAGHLIQLDQPAALATCLTRWLGEQRRLVLHKRWRLRDGVTVDQVAALVRNRIVPHYRQLSDDVRLGLEVLDASHVLAIQRWPDRATLVLLPVACRHCENPHCMSDCPVDAITRAPTGEVFINQQTCIGCANCHNNCPYGVISMVDPTAGHMEPQGWLGWLTNAVGLTKPRHVHHDPNAPHVTKAVKCDLCKDTGGSPACVAACPTGAAIRVAPETYMSWLRDGRGRS